MNGHELAEMMMIFVACGAWYFGTIAKREPNRYVVDLIDRVGKLVILFVLTYGGLYLLFKLLLRPY